LRAADESAAVGEYETALRKYDEVVSASDDAVDESLVASAVRALVKKGSLLLKLGEVARALGAFDSARERLDDRSRSSDAAQKLDTMVVEVLMVRARELQSAGELHAALDVLEQVANRRNRADPRSLQSMVNRAELLSVLGRHDDAVVAAGEAVEATEDVSGVDPVIAARALGTQGMAWANAGQYEGAIRAFSDLVSRFGDAESTVLRAQCGLALLNKAMALKALEDVVAEDEALKEMGGRFGDVTLLALDNNIKRYTQSAEPGRAQVVSALYNKATILHALERDQEALDVIEALLDRERRAGEEDEPPTAGLARELRSRIVGDDI
jgi:tetratricopeptide (TPR) repeat protein